jgi:hypothetical protein
VSTIDNKTITTGVTIGSAEYPSPLTITSTGTVTNTGYTAVSANPDASYPTLVNYGRVAGPAGVVLHQGFVDNKASGYIGASDEFATGVYLIGPLPVLGPLSATGPADSLANGGTVHATGTFGSTGVHLFGIDPAISNSAEAISAPAAAKPGASISTASPPSSTTERSAVPGPPATAALGCW